MKKKKAKRKKLPKIKTVRSHLWETTKTIIRARFKVKGGWLCYTCEKLITEPKKAHTGHLLPRVTGGLMLYYHLEALRVQCDVCNRHRGGEGAIYMLKIIDEIGIKKATALIKLRHVDQKPTREFFQTMLDSYKDNLNKTSF